MLSSVVRRAVLGLLVQTGLSLASFNLVGDDLDIALNPC